MKNLKKSFLFFIALLCSSFHQGQEKIDSLRLYSELVLHPNKGDDLISSYNFFKRVYIKSLNDDDKSETIYALWHIASAEFKMGFYNESEESSIKALELCDKMDDSEYLRDLKKGIYNHLGILYRRKKLTDEAIEFYRKTFELVRNKKDSITVFNNIANTYLDNRLYSKAKVILEGSLSQLNIEYDTILRALVLDNLGIVKSEINKEEGLNELKESLVLRKAKKNFSEVYLSYYNLSNFYRKNFELEKSKEYALKSLEIANGLNSVAYKQKTLGLLVELSDNEHVRLYKKINDSIIKAHEISSNKFAFLKYNTVKQEQETEHEKKQKQLFQFIGSLILLISFGGYFFYRERNKKKIVENVIQTEGRISKTVHDVIANDLYQIMSKIQLKDSATDEVLDDLDAVYLKARNISRDNYVIDEEMSFSEILNDMFESYQTNKVSIASQVNTFDWSGVSIHKRNMLYRVLKELLTNMAKYSEATLVTIVFKQKGKKVEVLYKDNGVGCLLTKRNGLVNAENRIKSVDGKIIFESEPGIGFITKIII
ncbi:Tetratricopeptide repeat-containing sensor histidine kinase [Tenacibaculum sp. 190130A14a]|uniref:histidine kinase n=1 Tax=Tenacibaculum polynesiense TaxID=3137857 RepID=A0ABP1F6S8_9FLAO